MDRTRVVITGLGAVSSLGNTAADTWRSARDGIIGIGPLTKFEADGHAAKVASEVHDLPVHDYLDRREARRMDLFTVYAMIASMQALHDAGLDGTG
ncbi:MAG: beta-ketoacyl synthase N-terminal-like domain-containing protein, partial [Spirochaetaceae bacterium]|nr:beta-ketoacyl synthase N-terminal-like domain-containing protein [Spirochaetaceae bacterium]